MAIKWTLMRSRRFEISFEKTETIRVAKSRETVVLPPDSESENKSDAQYQIASQIESPEPATTGGEDDQL